MGFAATFPLGEAREDWKIVRALSDAVGQPLPFDDLGALRQALMAEHDTFAAIDTIEPAPWGAFGASGGLEETPFVSPIENFYMTDPISRASKTMAECTEVFTLRRQPVATGTHG